MRIFLLALPLFFLGCQLRKDREGVAVEEEKATDLSAFGNPMLSSYAFFTGDMKALQPAAGVYAYTINSPLFSDYAFKKRFIRIPQGKKAIYNGEEVFDFPEGTVLIKNFYYPADFRQPEENIRLLETRLLTLQDGNWEPLTYVWNIEQTEAFLEVAGKSVAVSWTHTDGVLRTIDYSVPSINQCKGCHLKGDKVMPIGLSARQLNNGEKENQLLDWQHRDLLSGLPNLESVPRLVAYEDVDVPNVDRTRAWLEINCAHCHRPDGQAKNSGLHLSASVTSGLALGVGKSPVAAGQGSGGRRFSVVPGYPDESILLFRIESMEPGIMMPEMGRKLVHAEGVELVRRWILEMK